MLGTRMILGNRLVSHSAPMSVDGKVRLHGDWLNTNLAYELRPSTDHDTTSVDLWVPLPKESGEYKVHVDLTLDGRNVASAESPPFK
ncbi:hypothetical protein Amsp01_035840 [Amycolatopsis sp. NBRC 101858]|nr:hypothetical protein Amsp01_035840 [Amycolatopsis sp. NBRC 101858]